MTEDTSITIHTKERFRVHLDKFDDGLWMSLRNDNAGIHTYFTYAEAEQLLAGLQAILAKEVTA